MTLVSFYEFAGRILPYFGAPPPVKRGSVAYWIIVKKRGFFVHENMKPFDRDCSFVDAVTPGDPSGRINGIMKK